MFIKERSTYTVKKALASASAFFSPRLHHEEVSIAC
jgi:hypothetical protein